MDIAKSLDNQKIAIVGINAYFSCCNLDEFERGIYQGKPHSFNSDNMEHSLLSVTEISEKFDSLAKTTLKSVDKDITNATVIVAGDTKLAKTSISNNITEADSVFQALAMAQKLLIEEQTEIVLVGGIKINPEHQVLGVVVLKLYETAKQKRNHLYAIIEALNLSPNKAAIKTEEIAYLEVISNCCLEKVAIEQLFSNSHPQNPCSCAISTLTNFGYFGVAAEIASLIKTSLCLYYRYLPPIPQWQQPFNEEAWQNSPFYVVSEAKPWFLEAGIKKRVAAINRLYGERAYLVLSEATELQQRSHTYLQQTPSYLFPLAAFDSTTLLEQLRSLKQTIETEELSQTAIQTFSHYQKNADATYAITIVGRNKPEILQECDRAVAGVTKALATGKDWQTPVGSYFTPNPQGKKGQVVYVYPSAYNAHLGLGKDLFRLFPNLIDNPVIQNTCNRVAKLEKLLYPRSWKQLSRRELEIKERELINEPLAMLESETGFAGLITTILRDYFQLHPQAAFGYSLGETSMMYSQGVWNDLDRSSNLLNTSPLFKTRLAGSQDAVREYWHLSARESQKELWRTYVVMANSDEVRNKLEGENRVYLTQISTLQEVVIAGEPQACERVIKSLNCDAFRAPFNHVIHCEAMISEYASLLELNTLPLHTIPNIDFYFAGREGKMELEEQAIAQTITKTLIQQLDFPGLVNRVYQDGYRIFVEVGAGSNCSRWIKDILKSQEHATISLHRRSTDDFTSLIKALAKLVSHRVQLNLSFLYKQATQSYSQDRLLDNYESTDLSSSSNYYPQNNLQTIEANFNNPNELLVFQPNFLKLFLEREPKNNIYFSKSQTKLLKLYQDNLAISKNIIQEQIKILQKIINNF